MFTPANSAPACNAATTFRPPSAAHIWIENIISLARRPGSFLKRWQAFLQPNKSNSTLRTSAILALALAACTAPGQAAPISSGSPTDAPVQGAPDNLAGSKPNVIVILADDLGWGDISLNGANLIQTPNIDRLGREGVQLTHFYAGANVCTPSRAALLTGRYPIRSGMQHVIHPKSEWGMPSDEVTIAELMKQAGYATGMIGKWHLGHRDAFWPTNQGFDEFYGVPYSNDMTPFDLYRQKEVVESPADQDALSDHYAAEAVNFIERHADAPFFLYFAQNFPHIPLHIPDYAAGQSGAGLYGDVVQHVDQGVGAILDALDQAGIADNTLVIFTSDNGPWFEGASGDHRGRKGGTYEGSYLVPFLARWPQGIQPGVKSDAMAMNIDLLPTLANLAGADAPEDRTIDGRDILPLMEGGNKSPHDFLFFFNGNDVAGVRNERYRMVLNDYYRSYYVPFEAYGATLLFDLMADPEERFSYVRDNPEVLKKLKAAVADMRGDIADLAKPEEDPRQVKDGPAGPVLNVETE